MNRSLKSLVCGVAFTGAFLIAGNAQARQDTQQPAPDNTKVNQGDRKSAEPTADQGKNNLSDQQYARRVAGDGNVTDELTVKGEQK